MTHGCKLEAEELPHAAVCQGCSGRALEPWALDHKQVYTLVQDVLTHVLPIFSGPIFAPVDLSVPLICVEATPWGLSVKYIAIDLCYSYICLLTQFNFKPFILVP